MGITTRRKPVTFDIPKAPDYKFLNVTSFNGLNITDNPFTADATTASDCLNVYVDENNALCTRPRIENKFPSLVKDIKQLDNAFVEIFNVYKISKGYLIHYLKTTKNYGFIILDKSEEIVKLFSITGANIPNTECSVFEKDGLIYIKSKKSYGYVEGSVYKTDFLGLTEDSINAYIPLYRSYNEQYSTQTIEPLNILTDKFKEAYFWKKDNIINNKDIISAENTSYDFYKNYSDNTYVQGYADGFYLEETYPYDRIHFVSISNNNSLTSTYLTDETGNRIRYGDVSCDQVNKIIAVKLMNKNIINIYKYDTARFVLLGHIDTESNNFKISTSGKYLWIYNTDYTISLYKINIQSTEDYLISLFATIQSPEQSNRIGFDIATLDDYDIIFGMVYASKESVSKPGFYDCTTYIYKDNISASINLTLMDNISVISSLNTVKIKHKTSLKSILFYEETFNSDSLILMMAIYKDGDKEQKVSKLIDYKLNGVVQIEPDDSRIYFVGNSMCYMIQQPYSLSEILPIGISTFDISYMSFKYYITDFINPSIYFNNNKNEPTYFAIKEITALDVKTYTQMKKYKSDFLKSFLNIRFENDRWFASGNHIYRTMNNDPTYIPLTRLELDSDENPITGFNLAEDTLLIAYKKDKIFSISKAQLTNSIIDYRAVESKNTVGNVAYGSSIVSVLTETPIQISYSGIYALNQLKNVQSSDRISVLISGKINEKFLKEPKEAIEKMKTANYLYWTFFVLSYKGVTRIYLLDNRNLSWFYWEIPIVTINVLETEDGIELVNNKNCIYSLETDDIVGKYNIEETEYYDSIDGYRILIEWYWKSQIMPLGTINYSKKLLTTTFILADEDMSDEYGLDYKFNAYRKYVSESSRTTISNQLNLIQSTTKKTLITRFNFLQLELHNVADDFNNNKLRLLGVGLKYVLLGGMN